MSLPERVRALSPRLQTVTRDDLEARPELLQQIEVIYGGLKREEWPQATGVKWLQTSGAGVNGLPFEALPLEIIVTNVSGIHAEPITEQMFGMLLAVTRDLNRAWEHQKTREWRDFKPDLGGLWGKTLGVLGVGAIGSQSARIGRAFGMRVIGLRRGGESHPDIEEMFVPDNRLKFFARCDVVMNTLPLTEHTRGFMGAQEFEALPQGAIVINTGRGATMDTQALMNALQSGHLKAALLDVTDPEPLPSDHPLWTMPNVVITPHYSGGHPDYDARAEAIFLDNLHRYLDGAPLHHVVDKVQGY